MSEEPEAEPAREIVAAPKPQLVAAQTGFIVPTTLDEAYRYAVAVVQANLAPDSYGNDPSKVMIGIAAAMEAGLPPMYGLRQIAIINGRPTLWGDACMALVQSHNVLANQEVREIGSGFDPSASIDKWPDDFGILVRLWRRGQEAPYEGKFTIADAKRAGLWMNTRKKPWIEHPRRMLTARARAFALRDGFADCLAGLAVREEVEDTFGADKPAIDAADVLSDEPEEIEE